jgi:hypothetical protein
VRQVVAEAYAAVAAVQALALRVVRDLDERPGAVPGARADKTAATFLVHKCRVSPGQAHRDVAAAHAIDPTAGSCRGWVRLWLLGRSPGRMWMSRSARSPASRLT